MSFSLDQGRRHALANCSISARDCFLSSIVWLWPAGKQCRQATTTGKALPQTVKSLHIGFITGMLRHFPVDFS